MSTTNPTTLLGRACRSRDAPGAESLTKRLEHLRSLEHASFTNALAVKRLHGLVCFFRAFPPDVETLALCRGILGGFGSRSDLRKYREQLADTGIAGTKVHYAFYWQTAKWIYHRWPAALSIDWTEFETQHGLDNLWSLLLTFPATEALEHISLSPRDWIETLKLSKETDAAFLIRHFKNWSVEEAVREKTWDDLDIPLVFSATPTSPSTTLSIAPVKDICFSGAETTNRSVDTGRAEQAPASVTRVGSSAGNRLIDLARGQMVTRGRDLFAFMHADPGDVRLISYDRGLQFVGYGLLPQHRCLLEVMQVFLILKNGVPVGYTQATALLRSAEINFNLFEEFRGAETGWIFEKTLAMVRTLFEADTFVINTQQLGEDNAEALKTGAFWFYHKHGFRATDRGTLHIVKKEMRLKRNNPTHRSNIDTLRKLSASDLYLSTSHREGHVVTTFPYGAIALCAACTLEQRTNGPEDAICRAMKMLGFRQQGRLLGAKKIAWERWSPLVLSLPGIKRWGSKNKQRLAQIIEAKGARSEMEFVPLFDAHQLLQKSLLNLAAKAPI